MRTGCDRDPWKAQRPSGKNTIAEATRLRVVGKLPLAYYKYDGAVANAKKEQQRVYVYGLSKPCNLFSGAVVVEVVVVVVVAVVLKEIP